MFETSERDVRAAQDVVSAYDGGYGKQNAVVEVAAYREEIEAPLRAEIERLREALERVVDHAEDWHEHYCELWGERRKEQQDAILGDILFARALLTRESAEPAEERGPEVGALLWMAEHVMGADAAEALRGWLDHFRAEGRLVVRDAAGLEIAHYPEEGDR